MRTVKCGIDVVRLIREKGEATLWDLELLMPNFLEEKISTDLKEEHLRHEEKQPRSRRKKISTKHTAWIRKKREFCGIRLTETFARRHG